MRQRFGSFAISRRVMRACGMPCENHGFLPRNSPTSQCSKLPREKPPTIFRASQNSPVFS